MTSRTSCSGATRMASSPLIRAREARRTWREKHPSPTFLRDLQDYRHQLVHSGPFMHWAEGPYFPRVGHHRDFCDWRRATAGLSDSELARFAHASEIVEEAWDHTVRYLDTSWRQLLRLHGKHRTRLPLISPFRLTPAPVQRVAGLVLRRRPTYPLAKPFPWTFGF